MVFILRMATFEFDTRLGLYEKKIVTLDPRHGTLQRQVARFLLPVFSDEILFLFLSHDRVAWNSTSGGSPTFDKERG